MRKIFNLPRPLIRVPVKFLRVLLNEGRFLFWTKVDKLAEVSLEKPTLRDGGFSESPDDEHSARMRNILQSLERDGVAVIEDFLPEEELKNIQTACFEAEYQTEKAYGDGVMARYAMLSDAAIRPLSTRVQCIVDIASGRKQNVTCSLQHLRCISRDTGDPNTSFHIDRITRVMKVFYFPFPIGKSQAPFQFYPSSHIVDERFKERYSKTVKTLPRTKRPFLICENMMDTEPVEYSVRPNCLVLASTNGVHRRAPFTAVGEERMSIRFLVYENFASAKLVRLALRTVLKGK